MIGGGAAITRWRRCWLVCGERNQRVVEIGWHQAIVDAHLCARVRVLGTTLAARRPRAIRDAQSALGVHRHAPRRPLVKLHEDGGERRVDDERHQKEEGEQREDAEEDEEGGDVEEHLLLERLLLGAGLLFHGGTGRRAGDTIGGGGGHSHRARGAAAPGTSGGSHSRRGSLRAHCQLGRGTAVVAARGGGGSGVRIDLAGPRQMDSKRATGEAPM